MARSTLRHRATGSPSREPIMRLHSALLILALVGLTAGCVLGPGTGIRDRFDYSAAVADYALLARMRRVQLSGGIGMRVRRLERDEAVLMTFRQKVDPAVEADLREIRQLLGLDPGAREFRVVYGRSEEHTSELQSLAYLVCRLLLEKKKKTRNTTSRTTKKKKNKKEKK